MRKTKYIALITIFCSLCIVLKGQNKHEISVYGTGGLSAFKYDVITGDQKTGMGSSFGVGYTYFLSDKLGVTSGAEIALYNSKMNFDNLYNNYITKDYQEESFELRSTITDYEEKQNAMYINIPLMLQFQTGNKNKFFVAAGGKIGFSMDGRYKSSGASIKNTGYYEHEDYEYTTQEFLGFGTFASRKVDEEVKFKMSYMLSAEAGIKWTLKEDLFLYTGAYVDYGLNNIQKEISEQAFIAYNPENPRDFFINSILSSQSMQDNKPEPFVDKISIMAAGIKIRLSFGLGSLKK